MSEQPNSARDGRPATYRYAPSDCPSDHERGMVYDPDTDDAVCPLCGKHESTEMGSL